MSGFTFDFSFLFPEPRPANEGREDERRCLGEPIAVEFVKGDEK